jgi:hypothetical protein
MYIYIYIYIRTHNIHIYRRKFHKIQINILIYTTYIGMIPFTMFLRPLHMQLLSTVDHWQVCVYVHDSWTFTVIVSTQE